MATPGLANEHLAGITLESPLPLTQIEGGDVVVHLSPKDVLVVRSEDLAAVSSRFRVRFSSSWRENQAREITHPVTGQKTPVYEYKLIYADGTFTITDEGKPLAISNESMSWLEFHPPGGDMDNGKTFCFSELSSGFPEMKPNPLEDRSSYQSRFCKSYSPFEEMDNSIRAHKMLFALLYRRPVIISDLSTEQAMLDVINTIALAEFYDFLHCITRPIEEITLGLSELWKDIASEPSMYLAIGTKIRSAPIFSDALRHYIGQGGDYHALLDDGVLTPGDVCGIFLPASIAHQGQKDALLREIRLDLLHHYQAHANATSCNKRGSHERTTWLASNHNKTLDEKCEFIAKTAFREWLDQQLVGFSHWSHIKYGQSGKKDGEVVIGTFRQTCEKIVAAHKNHDDIKLLGYRLASTFAAKFNLKGTPHPAKLIARHLHICIAKAAQSITNRYPPLFENHYSDLARARYDDGLAYYTRMEISEYDMPWSDLPESEDPEIAMEDLEEASVEWMDAVKAARRVTE